MEQRITLQYKIDRLFLQQNSASWYYLCDWWALSVFQGQSPLFGGEQVHYFHVFRSLNPLWSFSFFRSHFDSQKITADRQWNIQAVAWRPLSGTGRTRVFLKNKLLSTLSLVIRFNSRFLSSSGTLGHSRKWAAHGKFPFPMYSALCLPKRTYVTHFLFHFNTINISDARTAVVWMGIESQKHQNHVMLQKLKKRNKGNWKREKSPITQRIQDEAVPVFVEVHLHCIIMPSKQMEKMSPQDGH